MQPYSADIPYIERATSVLKLFSPWWSPLMENVSIHFTDEKNTRISGLASGDLVVEREFMYQSSPMEIAISLEFAIQQIMREMPRRSNTMRIDNQYIPVPLIALACSLEINSDMSEKFERIHDPQWIRYISTVMNDRMIDSYGVEAPPELYEGALLPEDLGLERGLKAENYLIALVDLMHRQQDEEPEPEEEQDESPEDTEQEPTPANIEAKSHNSSSGNEDPENTESHASDSDDPTESEKSEQNDESSESEDLADTEQDSESSDDSDTENESHNKTSNEKDNDTRTDHSKINDTNSESTNTDADQVPSDAPADGTSESEGDTKDSESQESLEAQERLTVQDVLEGESSEVKAYQLTMPKKEIPADSEGDDEPDDEPFSLSSISQEMAEIMQSSVEEGGQFSSAPNPTDDFLIWSRKKLPRSTGKWKKALEKIVGASMLQAQMSGQYDMSYSKMNPNQRKNMPIMMGLTAYPPNITILIDTSASMLKYKDTSLAEFIALAKKLLIMYGAPITVVTADSQIQYANQTFNPESVLSEVGKTHYSGSFDFGEIIDTVATNGAKYKGNQFSKPDVLMVFTDCAFNWSYPEKSTLPDKYPDVITISVEPYDKAKPIVPNWVKENKNFVHVPPPKTFD